MRLRLRAGKVMRAKGIKADGLREFAVQSGIAVNTARSLYHEITTRVDLPIIDRVAKALGVNPLELFEVTENDSRPVQVAA